MGTSGLRRACILSLLFTSKARSLRSPKVQWALLVMPTLHTKHRTHVHRRMHMVLIQAGLLVPCLHRHLIRATLPTTHHMGTTRGTRHCRTCNIHRLMARLHQWATITDIHILQAATTHINLLRFTLRNHGLKRPCRIPSPLNIRSSRRRRRRSLRSLNHSRLKATPQAQCRAPAKLLSKTLMASVKILISRRPLLQVNLKPRQEPLLLRPRRLVLLAQRSRVSLPC